jgi:hypothetical protein
MWHRRTIMFLYIYFLSFALFPDKNKQTQIIINGMMIDGKWTKEIHHKK